MLGYEPVDDTAGRSATLLRDEIEPVRETPGPGGYGVDGANVLDASRSLQIRRHGGGGSALDAAVSRSHGVCNPIRLGERRRQSAGNSSKCRLVIALNFCASSRVT